MKGRTEGKQRKEYRGIGKDVTREREGEGKEDKGGGKGVNEGGAGREEGVKQ